MTARMPRRWRRSCPRSSSRGMQGRKVALVGKTARGRRWPPAHARVLDTMKKNMQTPEQQVTIRSAMNAKNREELAELARRWRCEARAPFNAGRRGDIQQRRRTGSDAAGALRLLRPRRTTGQKRQQRPDHRARKQPGASRPHPAEPAAGGSAARAACRPWRRAKPSAPRTRPSPSAPNRENRASASAAPRRRRKERAETADEQRDREAQQPRQAHRRDRAAQRAKIERQQRNQREQRRVCSNAWRIRA